MVLSLWLWLVDFEPLGFRRLGFIAWGVRILHAYGDFRRYFILQGGRGFIPLLNFHFVGGLSLYTVEALWTHLRFLRE